MAHYDSIRASFELKLQDEFKRLIDSYTDKIEDLFSICNFLFNVGDDSSQADIPTKQLVFDEIKINSSNGLEKSPHTTSSLVESMWYSISGGKRFRALILYIISYSLLNSDNYKFKQLKNNNISLVDRFAIAIEFIQAYSLVHDDLPAFDNDDFRRGKFSTHAKYGETTAILCGDALLNYATEVLLKEDEAIDSYSDYMRACHYLLNQSGISGMISGQDKDILLEREFSKLAEIDELVLMELKKTACLLSASFVCPFILFALPEYYISEIKRIAYMFGLAFQIQDDILDNEANKGKLGKSIGKDAKVGKKTFYTVLGAEKAKALCNELFENINRCIDSLKDEGLNLQELRIFIDSVRDREY